MSEPTGRPPPPPGGAAPDTCWCRRARAPAAAGRLARRDPPVPARPQRAGRRLRRRPGRRDRLHRAVHGRGTRWVEDASDRPPARWIAIRLLAAVLTGARRARVRLSVPDDAHRALHAAAARRGAPAERAAFDLGVFAVVVGATLLILTALAHQSMRAARRPGDDERQS